MGESASEGLTFCSSPEESSFLACRDGKMKRKKMRRSGIVLQYEAMVVCSVLMQEKFEGFGYPYIDERGALSLSLSL